MGYHIVLAWAAITKYHTLGGLNNRNLLSLSSGGCKSKVRVPARLGSGEDPLHALQTDAFFCVLTWQREREKDKKFSYVSSCKGTNLNIITSQRPHLQIPSRWGLSLQHMNFGGETIQSIAHNNIQIGFQVSSPLTL